MKESYGEGLATHTDPESCGAAREGSVEALTGERTGRVLSRESNFLRSADAVGDVGRQNRQRRYRETLSGSAFRVVAYTREDAFKLLSGELKIYVKTSESGNRRPQSFCPECGTPIHATSVGVGSKVYAIRLGTARQRDQITPNVQVWSRSAQPWVSDTGSIRKIRKAAADRPDRQGTPHLTAPRRRGRFASTCNLLSRASLIGTKRRFSNVRFSAASRGSADMAN